MATFHDLTTVQLKQAVQIREQISSLQEKLDALLGGSTTTKKKVGRPEAKYILHPEYRAKMAADKKARSSKVKSPAVEPVAKKKGGLTAAGRAKLSAAMKARWAARKKSAPALNAAKS